MEDAECTWRTQPIYDLHNQFLRKIVDMLLKDAVFDGTDRNNKVVEWIPPEDMKHCIDVTLSEEGSTNQELLKTLSLVVKYSVKTGHPFFINQLYSSLDVYGLAGQWVTDALNPSVYTYEVAPVFTLMEMEILSQMAQLIGYKEHDGVFCPGGSAANLYGMHLARFYHFPQVKETGVSNIGRLVVLTSEDAHYSIKKAANVLGIGSDNLYLVKVDSRGCMDVEHLKEVIKSTRDMGFKPFFVSATTGTTVLGAFDPVDEIADVCVRENIWLHVDAAWGGGVLISSKYKHKLRGIHRADSVTWNPHKLLAAPQQCSVFLTRHVSQLTDANSASAPYLFQKDKFYDTKYDTGDKYLQCGRRADVLKFWVMWKAKGSIGLEKHVNEVFDLAFAFTNEITKREGFELVSEPQFTNICFWYVPPSLRGHQHNEDYNKQLHLVAPKIKERMVKTGSMMITYQPLRGMPNFFRLVLQNSGVTLQDVQYFADKIVELGHDL